MNEARFGYNSLFNNITQQLAGVEDVDAEIGVPVKVTDKNSWGIPNIQLSNNLTSFGNPTSSPFQINDKVFQGVDNFSWIIGKHSLRMGGEYRYNEFPQLGNEFPRGQFFFNGSSPAIRTRRAPATRARTSCWAYMHNSIIAVALASADFRNSEWAAYVDDTWKVLPHLTITAGLRWEVAQPMLDASGHERECPAQRQRTPLGGECADMSQHPVLRPHRQRRFLRGPQFPLPALLGQHRE